MRLSSLVLACASVIGLTLVACTSAPASSSLPDGNAQAVNGTDPPASTGSSSSSSGSSTATTPSTSTSTSTTTSTSTAPSTAAGQCTNADPDACQTCCFNQTADTKAAEAKEVTVDAQWQACACAASRCGTACATDPYCKAGADPEGDDDDDANPACQTCLSTSAKTSDCDTQTQAAYDANEGTAAFQAITACEQKSGCPAGDDDDDDN